MATENVKIVISAQDRTKVGFGSASRGLKGLGSSFKQLGAIILGPLGIVAGIAALTAGISKGIKATADFEQQMSNIATLISGDSTRAIDDFREGIQALLKVTPKSAEELGAAAYQIVSAGIGDTTKALEVLAASSRLAVAGLGTTEEATDLLTSALNAFQIDSKDADKTANILFATVKAGKTTVSELARAFGQVAPIASEMGISLMDLQAATAALTTSGLKTSVAQTALKAAMSNLLKPTAEMQLAFEELGVVSGKQLIESSESIVDVFSKIRNTLADNEGAFAKAFGSVEGLAAVLSLTGAQGESYNSTIEQMKSGTDILGEAVGKQTEQFNAQWQILKNRSNVAFQDLAVNILPTLVKVMSALPAWTNKFIIVPFQQVTDVLGTVIFTIDKLNNKINALVNRAKSVTVGLFSKITRNIGAGIGAVTAPLGFATGGVVPGPLGAPVPAIVHGGETIIPAGKRGGGATIIINNPVLLDRNMVEKLSQEIGLLLRNDLRV